MKPRDWRTYYGYRPPTFRQEPMTASEVRQLAQRYRGWLGAERGLTEREVDARIAETRIPRFGDRR